MKEDYGSLLKEFEGLTQNERIKYMVKQQEEFLKGIDSGKLVEKIRKFRTLNIKDMNFAELSPEYSEHELELQLVNNIRSFLIEMGGDFTFIGDQYHLMAGSRDLYIDLLLFHRRL